MEPGHELIDITRRVTVRFIELMEHGVELLSLGNIATVVDGGKRVER